MSMSLLAGLLLLGFAAWQCLLYCFKTRVWGVCHRHPHGCRHLHLERVEEEKNISQAQALKKTPNTWL